MRHFFMKKHFNIKVSGRVQGVFFRASTKSKAEELAIAGFVQNEPDGSVYIEAEGEEEKLDQFIAWCKRGPELAEVVSCTAHPANVEGYKDFVI
jgi:acylphosphatase